MKEANDSMEKINVDDILRYLTLALIAVLIVALAVVVILPNTETRSTCRGLQYFLFLDQKMTESGYAVELLNGVRDIEVKTASIDGTDIGAALQAVASGEKFVIESQRNPAGKKINETFSSRLLIAYDIVDGIKDNTDSAICTGRVQ